MSYETKTPDPTELPELEALKREYQALQKAYKKQSRELSLLQKHVERNRTTAEVKENMSRVIWAKRSELERYMNLLMENFPDIVLLFNRESRIVYCTDSFLKICRIPAFGMVSGSHYRDLLQPYVSEAFFARIERAFTRIVDEKETVEMTEEIDFSREHASRNYSIQITPMLRDNSSVEGAMAVFYDNTEIIRAHREAERASTAKSDFLATVSHEIRTPMNAIIGVSRMLKGTGLDKQQRKYLTSIENSSNVLLNLINDILDFSKIEAGKLELLSEYFSLDAFLKHLQEMFELMFQQKGLDLFFEIGEDLPPVVYGDESRIRQILTNLLNNAFKYTERGSVVLSVQKEADDAICFKVRDTGIGIRKEAMDKLFSAFEQLDKMRNKKAGGTGLGLAITKHLCELMGGRIEVESVYSEGSCFTAHLPLAAGALSDLPEETTAEEIAFTAPEARVLLVDDIEINLDIAAYMLSMYRITPDLADSGRQALELLNDHTYDIIFMDHMMPEMDGIEATRMIRRMEGAVAASPIVALTANAVSGAMEMFLANGFNGFLSKPIDSAALAGCLLRWLPEEKIHYH